MERLMVVEASILRSQIVSYQNEYLKKKGIESPSAEQIEMMRKAVSRRLRHELKAFVRKHEEITNSVYDKDNQSDWSPWFI